MDGERVMYTVQGALAAALGQEAARGYPKWETSLVGQ
jgi:hypothetical protein